MVEILAFITELLTLKVVESLPPYFQNIHSTLFGESYWGKGYATELLEGIIDFIKRENKIKQ